ncbi:MAG: SH3 domain-containing protein [Verrucomicrobia bacterium]|nr:SH3 domain-containing protein [Verrucomicrobiota bacterium]
MSKFFTYLCASLCAYSATALNADAPMDALPEAMPEFPTIEAVQMPIEEAAPVLVAPVLAEPAASELKVAPKKVVEKVPEVNVNPFTGKIKGRKVRMRLRPDLDSRIIKELSKNELVTVVGEKGDFWAVQAPAATKAYIFRSFVLDNVVEGTRVNVRLEPSMDAPVVAHLNSGDKIENPSVSPVNPKWLEIAPPANTRFYIAKEYVEYAGGPEVKSQMDRKQASAEQLLDSSSLLSKAELRKPFEEVDFDRIVKGYNTVITDFSEFPELVEQAKEALASFQEAYLQKRITHLESQPAEHYASADSKKASQRTVDLEKFENIAMITDKMKLWEPIEEALYLSWANINDNKTQRDYYEEQKLAAVEISGIVEPYTSPVKSKPGDFILRDKDIPVGYVYSTQINLQSLVGKQVKMVAAPRPNNNFAFPAYYVLSVE